MCRSFLLVARSSLLSVGLVCYGGKLAGSSLLAVEILFGLFAYGEKIVSFSCPKIGFGLFCLRFPHRK